MRFSPAARADRRFAERFAEPAARPARPARTSRRAGLVLAGVLAGAGAVVPAQASPLDDAHVGGIGWGGPTNDDLSALFWNPAALGLQTGTRALVALGGQRGSHSVTRDPIDPVTGQPGGSRTFAPITGRSDRLPTSFPFGPGSFIASAQSVGSRVTFAAGVFTPFVVRLAFPATADTAQPARYHAVDSDVSSVALAPGLAVRLGGGLRVGLAPTFMLSRGSMTVDHDTGAPSGSAGATRLCGDTRCGAENPAAAARYAFGADTSLLDSAFSFTLGAGLHLQRPLWSAGLTFITPPLGAIGENVELEARATRVDLPPRLGPGATICPPGFEPCVASRVTYRLPMLVAAGFSRQLLPRLTLVLQARWLDLSVHDAIRVRLVGPAGGALRGAGLPDQLIMHRGLQDTFDLRVRTLVRAADWLEVSATLRGETAATSSRALSPATMGGALVEPALAARVRINSWLALSAGYAIAFSPTATSEGTLHDPQANAACEATGNDLTAVSCQKRQHGLAHPTASGRYRALTQGFSLALHIQRSLP